HGGTAVGAAVVDKDHLVGPAGLPHCPLDLPREEGGGLLLIEHRDDQGDLRVARHVGYLTAPVRASPIRTKMEELRGGLAEPRRSNHYLEERTAWVVRPRRPLQDFHGHWGSAPGSGGAGPSWSAAPWPCARSSPSTKPVTSPWRGRCGCAGTSWSPI